MILATAMMGKMEVMQKAMIEAMQKTATQQDLKRQGSHSLPMIKA